MLGAGAGAGTLGICVRDREKAWEDHVGTWEDRLGTWELWWDFVGDDRFVRWASCVWLLGLVVQDRHEMDGRCS